MSYRPTLHPGITLDRIYLRRLAWHTDSQAILSPSLAQPHLNVALDVQHNPSPRNPYVLEVTLFLNARCDNAGTAVFETKMQYTGIFRIQTPELASEQSVIDFCAAQVYPHLRREFANRTLLGGFQGLLLHDRHLETCLQRLFMGASTAQAGFSRIFGTIFNQRSQGNFPAKTRNGPPARVRIASRRALRSPWLLPVLAIPVVTSLLGGIHWWMDHRIPPSTKVVSTGNTGNLPAANDTPLPTAPAPAQDSAAAIGIKNLESTGGDWLAAQTGTDYTVVINRAKQATPVVAAMAHLTLNQPAFLLAYQSDAVIVTGVFHQRKEAVAFAEQFQKKHRGSKAEVVSLASLKGF